MKNRNVQIIISLSLVILIISGLFSVSALGNEQSTYLTGHVKSFKENELIELKKVEKSTQIAKDHLQIKGSLTQIENKKDVSAYEVNSDEIELKFKLNKDKNWNLINNNDKKLGEIPLNSKIESGAIIVQTSFNCKVWNTEKIITDAFKKNKEDTFYKTNDIQLMNGCYFRVIIDYPLQREVGEKKIAFFSKKEVEEKNVVELYEFYLTYNSKLNNGVAFESIPRKVIGQKINTGKDTGYSKDIEIDKNDPHFGWNLGLFVINGYTREINNDDNLVFLKNAKDTVTLWFSLNENIDCLNNRNEFSVSEDKNGYDLNFEVPQTNFGRGTLIIRFTDHEGKVHDPVIYTDFLEANVSTETNTKIQLFEEGDYEIALDYELKKEDKKVGPFSVLTSYYNYRIPFKFSIRNGNCIVFPFELETNKELHDQTYTNYGFKLDLAKSRYLTIDVIHSILIENENGEFIEDIRYNRPVKDHDIYTEPGIYHFKVANLYTGEVTTKTIFVGDEQYQLAQNTNIANPFDDLRKNRNSKENKEEKEDEDINIDIDHSQESKSKNWIYIIAIFILSVIFLFLIKKRRSYHDSI